MTKHYHPKQATPAETEAVKTQYATLGPKRLAEQLGVKPSRIKYIAGQLGLRCPHRPVIVTDEMRRIHQLASTPTGKTFAELSGSDSGTTPYSLVVGQVERMDRPSAALRVYRRAAMVNGRVSVRVFADQAHADAFSPHERAIDLQRAMSGEFEERRKERDREAAKAKRMREARQKTRATRGDRAVPPADEKPSIAKEQHIDYSRARVISVPAPRGRYEIDPDTRVLGGFATQGIGRYLDKVAA